MFLCQNVDFRFSYKKQWFFNSFEQPTSRRAPNFKARGGPRWRRDALSAPAHFLSEILKMLTVETYRKDIFVGGPSPLNQLSSAVSKGFV